MRPLGFYIKPTRNNRRKKRSPIHRVVNLAKWRGMGELGGGRLHVPDLGFRFAKETHYEMTDYTNFEFHNKTT